MKKTLLILTLISGASAQAQTLLQQMGNGCQPQTLQATPLYKNPVMAERGWRGAMAGDKNRELFDAVKMNSLLKQAGINQSVSSAHIVHTLVDGFKKIEQKEVKLIQRGELLPLEKGVTYLEPEYERRQDSVARARERYIGPMLQRLYRDFISAYQRNEERSKLTQDPVVRQQLYRIVSQQRTVLNEALKKLAPGVVEKIGEIAPVKVGSDVLPFAYKDGYIVKIRFVKRITRTVSRPSFWPQSPDAWNQYPETSTEEEITTLYPRLLVNNLEGKDVLFVQALGRWKDYVQDQWKLIQRMKQYGRAFGGMIPPYMISEEPLRARAAADTAADYLMSKRVHESLSQLKEQDLFSLTDLFIATRQGDIPSCQNVFVRFNVRMKEMLKGKKASNQLPLPEQKAIDAFARDVMYYHDIYDAFNTAAARRILQKQSRRASR